MTHMHNLTYKDYLPLVQNVREDLLLANDRALVRVGRAVAHCHELQTLNLSFTKLSPELDEALALCVAPVNSQLTYINIDCSSLESENDVRLTELPLFLKALERNFTVTNIYLETAYRHGGPIDPWCPHLKKSIETLCQLNVAGRKYMVKDAGDDVAGLQMLGAVSDNLDCSFYHLSRENPSLCQQARTRKRTRNDGLDHKEQDFLLGASGRRFQYRSDFVSHVFQPRKRLIFSSIFSSQRYSTMATRRLTRTSRLLCSNGIQNLVTRQKHVVPNAPSACFSTATASTMRLPVLTPPLQQLPSSVTPQDAPNNGLLNRLWSRYSLRGQQDRIHMAESLFQAATRQANDPRWFGPGRIPRDFRPRHAVLTMHIWFIHKRLILDTINKDYALMLQEELFNILWDDTTCRIRQAGVNELMVNKNLLQVQQYTFLHLTHYDHAFSPELLADPEQRLNELRQLVWYHILAKDEEVESRMDQLDRMAWYIDAQYRNMLMDWPYEYYKQGRLQWVDLPDFENMRDANGELLPENPVHPDDVLPEHWVKNITNRGVEYYWNEDTKESTWDRPV
ncbi:hypothetical protein MPSEU_000760700 [Mayamaea pseudoterrestris]|nr:hypothetical protein MPSEU_000760700 [Mayamaea pseudoterrestris]